MSRERRSGPARGRPYTDHLRSTVQDGCDDWQQRLAVRLSMLGWTQQEIGDLLGVSRQTITEDAKNSGSGILGIQRLAERVRASSRRREVRRQLREQFAAARSAGLRHRHAAKLRR